MGERYRRVVSATQKGGEVVGDVYVRGKLVVLEDDDGGAATGCLEAVTPERARSIGEGESCRWVERDDVRPVTAPVGH